MASDAGDNDTKIDRAMSQRWVDFKRTALRYDDGDEIYEEFGDDDYYNDDVPQPPQVSDPEQSPNRPAQEEPYDASTHEVPSRTTAVLDSEHAITTPVTYAAVQHTLGPTITAREAPKPLNINVAIAQQVATESSNTSLDSSIPSSVAGHEYSGLNRFGGLLAPDVSTQNQLDEVAESKDEIDDDETGEQQADHRRQALRIVNMTEDDYFDSPAAKSDKVDGQSTSLDDDAIRRQSQYLPPDIVTGDYDNTDESLQRNLQNLNRPVDSSASSSETGSVDRTDNGSARASYVGYSDRRSSYASTGDSAYLRLEDTAYNTTADSDDYFKVHDRSTSVGTSRSESEIMTANLLEQLEAQQALDSRRQSALQEGPSSPLSQKRQFETAVPGSPEVARSSLERPPIPVTIPAIIPELDPEQKHDEVLMSEANELSPASTVESDPEADDSEHYYDPSGIPAVESVAEKTPERYVPGISYLSAPYPGPRWNFSEIVKEPDPIKRKILFEAARTMEQRYDAGLGQWLLYMTHQRDDVQPFTMSALGTDSGKAGHHTIQRTTSMIGHSVSRYGEKSVEIMERVGERSKGIFHRSKLFGNKMTRECDRTTKEAEALSAQSKTSITVSPFSTIKDMHPVFKDSYLSSIKKSKDVSVYMVASIDYTSAAADYKDSSNLNGAMSSGTTDFINQFSKQDGRPDASRTQTRSGDEHDCGSDTDGDLSTLEATSPEMDATVYEKDVLDGVPESPFDAQSQTIGGSNDACIADLEYDVNVILSAYEDTTDSPKNQTDNSTASDSPSKTSTQTLQRHRSLRDFEPTLFTLPKVRSASSARIAAMRAASVAVTAEKDTTDSASPHTSASRMTQRRVVTAPALPEPKIDLMQIDSITKSFLSKELAIFDEIGNFDKASPTASFSVDYVAPRSMLLPEVENLPLRSASSTAAIRKPLPHEPPISSDEPVVVRPKNVPSFESGIPKSQRSDGMSSKLKGLSKLRLPRSSSKPQAESFKRQSDPVQAKVSIVSEQHIVEEKALPRLPLQNDVVVDISAAPRNYAKRKPVGGMVPVPAARTAQPTAPDQHIQPGPQTYIVKPLPMEPGPAHVPKHEFPTPGSRGPKREENGKTRVEAKGPRRGTDFKSKFKDLMQMDAMGVTPATRAQVMVANTASGNIGGSSFKGVKMNMKTLKGRLQKRPVEQGAHRAEEDSEDTTGDAVKWKEQPSYVQQHQEYLNEQEAGAAQTLSKEPAPHRKVIQSEAPARPSSEPDYIAEDRTIKPNILRTQDKSQRKSSQGSKEFLLSSQPVSSSSSSSPAVDPVECRSMTEGESIVTPEFEVRLKSQISVASISASESLHALSYAKRLSEQEEVDFPPQITEENDEAARTETPVMAPDSVQELSAASSKLSRGSSSQSYHDALLSNSDRSHVETQPDMEIVDSSRLATEHEAALPDTESGPAVDVTPASCTNQEDVAVPRGQEKYRRRRSSMPDWSPIDDMLNSHLRRLPLKADDDYQNRILGKELMVAAQSAESPKPDPSDSPVYRHHKSRSDPQLAISDVKSSNGVSVQFSKDKPQIIQKSVFERQQAALTAQIGEPTPKIVYVVPDDYDFAKRPAYMRAISPALQMQAHPPGRMMVDPRYGPPPRQGIRVSQPGYTRRYPQQWMPQRQPPPMHRSTQQAPIGPGLSQRLRRAQMMDSDNIIPIIDSDRVPSGRPHESVTRGGMMPPRDYYDGGYRSRTPELLYGPSDDYLSRNARQRPGYAIPPLVSSSSTASNPSGGARSQSSSGSFYQGPSAATAKEHMLRMATTPDFDAGAFGSPKRFPKRHL
ncbi:uncharacterized protein V1513DRAFT_426106 [Lipomyces chichibuensis]|uniref:uncharacterized protein n=1 Tax=Lipomyces chichibuensis TaxID=1546026 RepID=UPI0033438822